MKFPEHYKFLTYEKPRVYKTYYNDLLQWAFDRSTQEKGYEYFGPNFLHEFTFTKYNLLNKVFYPQDLNLLLLYFNAMKNL